MGFEAKILLDSIAPSGVRMTTMQWTFNRTILAEVGTHRSVSKNAASSRAIPVKTMIRNLKREPFIPIFCANQKGMQAAAPLTGWRKWLATKLWLCAMHGAISIAKLMIWLNIHKQYVNRLLEPWMWCTIIISATDWENLFALRTAKDAEPSFQKIAGLALEAMRNSEPVALSFGAWHLPLVHDDDRNSVNASDLRLVSAGRCARVSYLTHDGRREPEEDIDLAYRLLLSNHMSPFEHQACAGVAPEHRSGNLRGWGQFRKMLPNECRSFDI